MPTREKGDGSAIDALHFREIENDPALLFVEGRLKVDRVFDVDTAAQGEDDEITLR